MSKITDYSFLFQSMLGGNGIVLDSGGGMHGVDLMNVKAVVDKYGGNFAISCDEEKFQAVVML